MKFLTMISFLFLISIYAASQDKTITGTVTDSLTNGPLTGVNVLIEGTTKGAMTDLNGKFSIARPASGAVISFSYIGYTAEKITYSGQSVIDIKLSQNVKELDQVVVIGYGSVKKSDLTGSISKVSSKDIEKATPVNIESALQGRVAGLMITSNEGGPGNEPTVRIRGIGTVNDNDPIFVVDGMILDNSDKVFDRNTIGFLNPNDIESVEVLKDASAQAIYGSRGANGVILITTRKGSEGAPKISFSSGVSYEFLGIREKPLSSTEYKDMVLERSFNDYMRTVPNADPNVLRDTLNADTRSVMANYYPWRSTDWMKDILQDNRLSQNYNFQISGGTKEIHYFASAGYTDQRGLLLYSDYKRQSYRLNTDFKVSNHVTIGENLAISTSTKYGDFLWTQPVRDALWADPLTPAVGHLPWEVDKNDPDYYFLKYLPDRLGNATAPMDAALINHNVKHVYLNLAGNVYGEAVIMKYFKLRSSLGFEINNKDATVFSPKYYITSKANNMVNTLSEGLNNSNGWVWENTLTLTRKLGNHSIMALAGYTSEFTHIKTLSVSKKNIPYNTPEMQTFDAATTEANVSGGFSNFSMISYIGRINYSYRDKYLLTASLRRDGSSKFGTGNKWGFFPSFAFAWKLIEPDELPGTDSKFINSLKLRAGWGQLGNSSLPVYNSYLSQVSSAAPGDDLRYIFNEQVVQGFWLSTIGTKDITWETTEQSNVGIDLILMRNALSVTADYYIKNTRNMLLQVPYPSYAGYPGAAAPYSNAGSMQNKGFEIILDYKGKSGEFNYEIALNGSSFKNRVTSLGPGNRPIISGLYSQSRTDVGKPAGYFYGYVTNGIFQSDYAVSSMLNGHGEMLQPNARAGDFRFMDLNKDGIINTFDQKMIGTPWPKLTYGLNVNLGYKAFDLVIFFQGSYGNNIYDQGRQYGNSLGVFHSRYYYINAWRGLNTSNSFPLLTEVDSNGNFNKSSTYYVENGSFIRLKNFQLGYNLPGTACKKMKISQARLWLGGTNLLTFTKYHGNDPEVASYISPTQGVGVDGDGYYPKPIEVSLGITITI